MNLNKKNRYEIGGIDVLSLTEKFGQPIYVYDGEKIKSQYHRLKNAFGDTKVKIK